MNENTNETRQSDEELMRAVGTGSEAAFAELFGRYKRQIHGYFGRRMEETAAAEELTQEAFLAVLRGAARYEQRATFRTYLYAIALKLLRAHRRKSVFRGKFAGYAKEDAGNGIPDRTEASLWVRGAVEKLNPMDREILLLREFEELSYDEIAELLQLPLNTVRSRLFRAREALRELLKPRDSMAAAKSAQELTQTGERA
jgi:RNA polymerase sigma-70 factor (ECF subfamily)